MHSQLRAFLIHFSASALVLGIITFIVLFWWYPGPMLALQGGWGILLVLLTVDLILGPSLTGYIYKPGKKWLFFDIAVIVATQLVALSYGVWTIHAQKPSYLAFTYDRFYLVPFINTVGELPADKFFPSWLGGVKLTTTPITPQTKSQSLDELIDEEDENIVPPLAIVATDAQPYPPINLTSLALNGQAIIDIESEALRNRAQTLASKLGLNIQDLRSFRVIGRKKIGIALVNVQNGQLLDIVR